MDTHHIGAFYRFTPLADPEASREALLELGKLHGISGTIIVSGEGLNGTVVGSESGLPAFLAALEQYLGVGELPVKHSVAELPPFQKFKVKIKPEIVTLRAGNIDPNERTGQYVDPEAWNDLIAQPDVVLIDTRNDFEVQMGQFQGALNPSIAAFRDFPDYVEQHLDPSTHSKVAMYCTGGIRCEKASAFLLERGFEQVFQLDGGILNYLERIPGAQSTWQGECFVFDERIAVDASLQPTKQQYPPRPGRD